MSIKIENTQIFGWEAAIRGARNPMNSWEKSDSWFEDADEDGCVYFHDLSADSSCKHSSDIETEEYESRLKKLRPYKFYSDMLIGPTDHKLLMNLCKGGTEESKWRRMVHVQMDVTAPLYWWKEFETYKVGTVSNSCSTMHKIQAKEFTLDDFSCEHLIDYFKDEPLYASFPELEEFDDQEYYGIAAEDSYPYQVMTGIIECLNMCRNRFLETRHKKYWWQMIQLLPSSYNQRRTIDLNYEVLTSQYRQRKDHKLDCWRQYCDWIRSLPYSEFITMEESK